MKRALLLGCLASTLTVAGCSIIPGTSGWRMQCHELIKRPPLGHPTPAHRDFEQLLTFRNYYKLERLGIYEHHFSVTFDCIEPVVEFYAVSAEGIVRRADSAWGGLAAPSAKLSSDETTHLASRIPPAMREHAKRVQTAHDSTYHHATSGRIAYTGSYRELVVDEIVPVGGGDVYSRLMQHATVTVQANEDLSAILGVASYHGGETRICWKDIVVTNCGGPTYPGSDKPGPNGLGSARATQPYWIDFKPEIGFGQIQLPALSSIKSAQTAGERTRFATALLDSARHLSKAEPSIGLGGLTVQSGSTLPKGITPPLTLTFSLYGRTADPVKQVQSVLEFHLSSLEILAGGAHATSLTRVGDVDVKARVDVSLAHPIPADAGAQFWQNLTIRYTITIGPETKTAEFLLPTQTLRDVDSASFTLLPLPEAIGNKPLSPPLGQHFGAIAGFTGIDTGLSLSSRYKPWWGM